jgi:Mn2+/Fe2+ NRAMP family transporter
MFVTSASVMAAAAGTLHARGLHLESASQMVSLLEPLAGPFAAGVFVAGIVAAGLSSQFPNVTLLPCMLDDYYERGRSLRRTDYRVAALLISLLGLAVPVLGARPVEVMILSQAFGALVLPATVAGLLYLGNRRDLMGERRFGGLRNALLGATLLFAALMSVLSYRGILAALQGSGS